jgi:integrase/recombinase XerD
MGFPFLYSTKTLRLWVKEILGCEFTPHSIRRSFATHLLKNGANAKFVMLQMGHEKIETTFRYLHLNLKENHYL